MSATARPAAESPLDPKHLTVVYTDNEDGWVTAQIAEFPEAISQGASRHEAWVNVLDALHDLTHEPTAAEKMAAVVQALVVQLGEAVHDVAGSPLWGEVRDRVRAQIERAQRQRTY